MKTIAINFNTSFPKLQFASKRNKPPELQTPYGADYEVLDTLDLTRSTNIPQMKERLKSGDDISIDREKLIYSRISKAKKDAEKFVEEHPEFSYDDVLQDLICFIVKSTDADLQSGSNIYGSGYQSKRDKYFDKLINNQSDEEALISELPVFIDHENVEDLAIQSAILGDILAHTFDNSNKTCKRERNKGVVLMYALGYPLHEIGVKYHIAAAHAGQIIKHFLERAQYYARDVKKIDQN